MKLDCVVLVVCRRAAMYKVVHKMMQKHSGKSPIPVDAEKLQSVRARPTQLLRLRVDSLF